MTWKGWLFLVALSLALFLGSEGRSDESKYVTMCFEVNCPKVLKNTVYILSGPTNLQVPGEPNETSMAFGYMRQVLPDLSIIGGVLGTNKRFLGVQLGLGYHF